MNTIMFANGLRYLVLIMKSMNYIKTESTII